MQHLTDQWGLPLIDQWEKEWRKSLPPTDEMFWIDLFPEATPIIRRGLRRQLEELRKKQKELQKDTILLKNSLVRHPATEHYFIESGMKNLQEKYDKITKEIRIKAWLLKRVNGAADDPDGINLGDFKLAKDIPLTNFLQGKKLGRFIIVSCPWHSDSTPSFYIYQNNTWHCFGCNEGGDVIDFISKKLGMKNTEAVRWLLNK